MPLRPPLMTPVAFDEEVLTPDGFGGNDREWQEAFRTRAEFRYESGDETVIGGGLTGTASFKVKIRSHMAAQAVTTDYRMRDIYKGLAFNIREVDRVTDQLFVWLVVESGVAI